MKFYIHTGGGLGDVIKHYFWGHYGWQYTKSIKEKHPESQIKLLTTCCNPVGHKIFKFHPYIDKIESYPWYTPNQKWKGVERYIEGYKNLAEAHALFSDITSLTPDMMYLSDNDKEEVTKHKPKDKFIVMHPFAGDAIRTHMSLKQYFVLAQQLIKMLSCKIIIVGGNSQRVIGKTSRHIEDNFPYAAKGIINLVNKINLRSAFELTRMASYFIGTNSCFFCVRLALNQPRVIYSTKTNILQIKENIKKVLGGPTSSPLKRIRPSILNFPLK